MIPITSVPNSITKNAAIAAVVGAMLVRAIVVVVELRTEWKANSTVQERENEEKSC